MTVYLLCKRDAIVFYDGISFIVYRGKKTYFIHVEFLEDAIRTLKRDNLEKLRNIRSRRTVKSQQRLNECTDEAYKRSSKFGSCDGIRRDDRTFINSTFHDGNSCKTRKLRKPRWLFLRCFVRRANINWRGRKKKKLIDIILSFSEISLEYAGDTGAKSTRFTSRSVFETISK